MRSTAAEVAPKVEFEAADSRPERRSPFPFTPSLRQRIVVVALLLFGAGMVGTEYGLRPSAYQAMAFVAAPLAASYRDPGMGSGDPSADRVAVESRETHAQQERSLLAAAIRGTRDVTPAVPSTRLRRGMPRLSMRRTGNSNIVRVVVVASTPREAASLANAATRILIRQERVQWQTDLQRAMQTGSVPSDLLMAGASIRVLREARLPRLQNHALHVFAELFGIVLLILAATCAGVLATEWWSYGRRHSVGALRAGDLRVPVVALLRVAPSGGASGSAKPAESPTFWVDPALWSYLDALQPMRSPAAANRQLAILVGPCDANFYADTAGSTQCRASALYLARLAAGRGNKVLIIDAHVSLDSADLAGPVDLPGLPGFAEAITGRTIAAQWLLEDEENPNLIGLSSGRIQVRDEHISGQSMAQFLALSANVADWIVVSAGPALESESIGRLWSGAAMWADVVLLINESGFAESDIVTEATAVLLAGQVPVVGQITWSEEQKEAPEPSIQPASSTEAAQSEPASDGVST
jgi:hypothetical protein